MNLKLGWTLFIPLFLFFLQPRAQSVTGLMLLDADANQDLFLLADGDTVDLAAIGTNQLSVRAETSGGIGSVIFGWNGNPTFQTENNAPYVLFGDANGNYNPWTASPGSYNLTATAYGGANGSGAAGPGMSITFVIVDGNSPPPPGGGNCTGTGTNTATVRGQLRTWHKVTIDFDGPFAAEDCTPNPFYDYRLQVTFTHGASGKTYEVPGYFAADGQAEETSAMGGNVWRCHFAPDETGTWTYTASFRTGTGVAVSLDPNAGTATDFDGLSGTFTIQPTNKTGRDFRRHGRLEYVGERYLRHAGTGKYFLKGGADAPENFLAYDGFDNTPNYGNRRKAWADHVADWNPGDPDWQNGAGQGIIGAVNYLAGKGMNVFSFLTMNINGDDKNVFPYLDDNSGTYPDYKFRFDVSKLAQWEKVFEHADSLGMYLHVKTQETENDLLLDGGGLGDERKIYYRELIARFGHHLALNWNLGEENDIWQEKNDPNQTRILDYCDYIRDVDPYDHHIVLHSYPNQQDEVYDPLLGEVNGLSGVSIQTNWNNVHSDTKRWIEGSKATGHVWVVANDEQGPFQTAVPPDDGFEGFNQGGNGGPSQDDIRRGTLWGNLMAGGAGVEYYFGYTLPHSDLSCRDWRSRDQMWDYTRYALQFFETIPFWEMEEADNLVSGGWGFAKEGEYYVAYFTNASNAGSLDMVEGDYNTRWYNPRTGVMEDDFLITVSNGQYAVPTPPSDPNDDWALLLISSALGSPFPIELVNFDATPDGAAVDLDWQTSQEQNSDAFLVQRSTDGQSFQTIGTVAAAGNSFTLQTYSYRDESPSAQQLFYRLEMKDLDGSSNFSDVVEVNLTSTSIQVYPQPVIQAFHIELPALDGYHEYRVRLYDLSGRLVLQQPIEVQGGQVEEISTRGLIPGLYSLTVEVDGQNRWYGKVLKRPQ